MGNTLSVLIILGVGLAVSLIARRALGASRSGNHLPLPPGPKGYPLVGNLSDLPKPGEMEAEHWLKHKKLYGPISSITVLGRTMVIINDIRIALELLEKRSVKYSTRPRQLFMGEMMGWEHSVGFVPYGDRLRTHRKNLARLVGNRAAVAHYDGLQEAEVGHFLLRLLDRPDDLLDHIKKEAGAVMLKMAYGYTVEPFKDDYLVDFVQGAIGTLSRVCTDVYLVDVLPLLKRLPTWLPGMQFKKDAQKWCAELTSVVERPYAFAKHQMSQGKDSDSFVSRILAAEESTPEEKMTSKWLASTLYVGGVDTTVAAVSGFFLAVAMFPEVQKKAQEEIDRVIGCGRLPSFSDRSNLPYIDAVVKEVLRWHTVVPMGFPHATSADDVFEGYFIPKGSILFANSCHFGHDPEVYKEPMVFNPDRFLSSEDSQMPPDPTNFVYGYGRRICPERALTDSALYLIIAQSLAVFSITQVSEEEGKKDIPLGRLFTPGIVSRPAPFQVDIRPRSPHHRELIRSLEQTYPWQESDAGVLESLEL